MTWSTDEGVGVSLNWRFIAPARLDTFSDNEFLSGAGPKSTLNWRVESYNYFDLAMTAPVTKSFSLRLGVNNFLDKSPPVGPSTVTDTSTYPGMYDILGRTFFAGFTAEF